MHFEQNKYIIVAFYILSVLGDKAQKAFSRIQYHIFIFDTVFNTPAIVYFMASALSGRRHRLFRHKNG